MKQIALLVLGAAVLATACSADKQSAADAAAPDAAAPADQGNLPPADSGGEQPTTTDACGDGCSAAPLPDYSRIGLLCGAGNNPCGAGLSCLMLTAQLGICTVACLDSTSSGSGTRRAP